MSTRKSRYIDRGKLIPPITPRKSKDLNKKALGEKQVACGAEL